MSDRNRKVIERIVDEVFNQNRLELIDELYSHDLCSADTATGKRSACRDQLRDTVKFYREAFPDHQYTLESIVSEGDMVAMRWVVRGSRTREIGDIKASERPFEFEGMSFCRLRDGKIDRIWQQFDVAALNRQLGFEAMKVS